MSYLCLHLQKKLNLHLEKSGASKDHLNKILKIAKLYNEAVCVTELFALILPENSEFLKKYTALATKTMKMTPFTLWQF